MIMDYLKEIITIVIAALFTNNIVLKRSLGICPFLGVSKKINSALGMGFAVIFVVTLSTLITHILYMYLLVPFELEYMQIVMFILIIASIVQVIEIVFKRFVPTLYNSMGVYLPLITTNCVILGTAQDSIGGGYDLFLVFLNSMFIGVGFLLALILMSGVRERIEKSDIPKPFRGFPITLLTAGIISMAFIAIGTLVFF